MHVKLADFLTENGGTLSPKLEKFINDNLFKMTSAARKSIALALASATFRNETEGLERAAIKMLADSYFPSTPNILSKDKFINKSKNSTIYYHGIGSKHLQDFLYKEKSFSGTVGEVFGTWITNEKDYAADYSNTQPLELILSNKARIITEQKLREYNFAEQITEYRDKLPNRNSLDTVFYQQLYRLGMLLSNYTFIALVKKYDAVLVTKNSLEETLVVLNKDIIYINEESIPEI